MRFAVETALAILTATLLLGCESHEATYSELAMRVGPERLVGEAVALGAQVTSERPFIVPREAWPASIRKLTPLSIYVASDGVFVQLSKRFVEEDGLFIAFPDTHVDVGMGGDPGFSLIRDQLYYYRVKG